MRLGISYHAGKEVSEDQRAALLPWQYTPYLLWVGDVDDLGDEARVIGGNCVARRRHHLQLERLKHKIFIRTIASLTCAEIPIHIHVHIHVYTHTLLLLSSLPPFCCVYGYDCSRYDTIAMTAVDMIL